MKNGGDKHKRILLNPEMLSEMEQTNEKHGLADLSTNPLENVSLDDLDNPFAEKEEGKVIEDVEEAKKEVIKEEVVKEEIKEVIKEEIVKEEIKEEAVREERKEIVEDGVTEVKHDESTMVKEETTSSQTDDNHKSQMELLYKKRDELLEKQKRINQIHNEIAELEKPAIRDVSALRNKIDGCFSYFPDGCLIF